MEFQQWEPVYEAILADFGYSRSGDERAREVLAGIVAEPLCEFEKLDFSRQTVAIAGGADSLSADLELVRAADVVVAASVGADCLREEGIAVDCMVTDIDKNPETARELTLEGTPVAVHAHGDNIPAVESHVPTFDHNAVIPTTQAAPTGPVRNFGGFTDGDRAAFLADQAGAAKLTFPGWEFDDPSVSPEKAQKLAWAERLLYWLERRRGEQFELLDGRRNEIDTQALPVG